MTFTQLRNKEKPSILIESANETGFASKQDHILSLKCHLKTKLNIENTIKYVKNCCNYRFLFNTKLSKSKLISITLLTMTFEYLTNSIQAAGFARRNNKK